jgi:hypothetical protein
MARQMSSTYTNPPRALAAVHQQHQSLAQKRHDIRDKCLAAGAVDAGRAYDRRLDLTGADRPLHQLVTQQLGTVVRQSHVAQRHALITSLLRIAIHICAADMHKPLQARRMLLRQPQHGGRQRDISLLILRERCPVRRAACAMKDMGDFCERSDQLRGALDWLGRSGGGVEVGTQNPNAWLFLHARRNMRTRPRKHRDGSACGHKHLDQSPSQEAGGTGYKNIFDHGLHGPKAESVAFLKKKPHG